MRKLFFTLVAALSVAQGYVTMSFPGSPNKPEQTYRLTEKGLDLYKNVMGE